MKHYSTLAIAAMLVACTPGKTDLATVIGDAQLLIGTPVASAVCPAGPCGLTGAYLIFKNLYPQAVTPTADAKIQVLLSSAVMTGGLLDQLKAAATAADQATDIRAVEGVANQVLGIIAGQIANVPNIDPAIVLGFQAAAILIPILEQAANQLVPTKPVVTARMSAAFINPAMTTDQARATLRR